jgi:hypothetical protein
MGILQVVWFGGIRLSHKYWLTEVTITLEVQARLASLLFPRIRVGSREDFAGVF